jgi:ABC-2 type transport system permease protein
MIANQVALIRREFWEHRSLYFVPAILGLVFVLASITGQVSISGFGEHVDMALLGATNIGANERGAAIALVLTGFAGLFVIAMWILIIFYSLDSLYAERKDRSILFWRSMPVTDAETVVSKLLTAMIVIPVVTLVFIALTQLAVLLATSIWVGMRGANAWHLIWSSVPLLDTWSATLIFVLAITLWQAPFIGWFLLVSAYTKRSPLAMAVLPVVLLPMLERLVFRTHMLSDAIFNRTAEIPIFKGFDGAQFFINKNIFEEAAINGISMVALLDVGKFIASPGLWVGLVVCALFVTAAMYVRRFRDDS